jgi:hypothetical protein
MPDRSSKPPKLPRDTNQRAFQVVAMLTGTAAEPPKPEKDKDPAAVSLGRKGGLKGGKARAAKLTPEERSLAAQRAARARWAGSQP